MWQILFLWHLKGGEGEELTLGSLTWLGYTWEGPVEWITCGTPAFVQLSPGHRAVNTRCNTWFQTIRHTRYLWVWAREIDTCLLSWSCCLGVSWTWGLSATWWWSWTSGSSGIIWDLGSSWRSATGSSCGCTCPGPSWPTRSSASPSRCRGSAGGSPEEGEIEKYLIWGGNCFTDFLQCKNSSACSNISLFRIHFWPSAKNDFYATSRFPCLNRSKRERPSVCLHVQYTLYIQAYISQTTFIPNRGFVFWERVTSHDHSLIPLFLHTSCQYNHPTPQVTSSSQTPLPVSLSPITMTITPPTSHQNQTSFDFVNIAVTTSCLLQWWPFFKFALRVKFLQYQFSPAGVSVCVQWLDQHLVNSLVLYENFYIVHVKSCCRVKSTRWQPCLLKTVFFAMLFIGPRSDHSLPMSLTD